MELVLKLVRFKEDRKDRKINEYDLVFLPIIWQRHFYVGCFNIKHSRVGVLDNTVVEDTLSIEEKYDGWVEKLVSILKTLYVETMLTKCHTNICKNVKLQQDAFANYLRIKKHPMAKIMKSTPIVRQKMDWRTESNGIGCGIFAMRHMETYMGQMTGWECGLAKEDAPNDLQQKQLNDLRIKYIAKILLHSQNENIRNVAKYLKKNLGIRGNKCNTQRP
ncbi:putative papain-like cysteine peptidase superfamily [Helianthus annuus]|uniref:Papain-like cysteine peptidase superfamily n=1 Tax=Helianthus annuus TaxID=4232 RepID=A0A9K3EAA0_HELAN|nr:putative papain-like cysteine peptidase superfamily [Helianthus annuus]